MSQTHRVLVLSDQDYDDLIAECYVDDDCIMVVSQERGPNVLDVEISLPLHPDGRPRRIEYDVVIELLERAKQRLWELRRV